MKDFPCLRRRRGLVLRAWDLGWHLGCLGPANQQRRSPGRQRETGRA